jgi:hypothetical protein
VCLATAGHCKQHVVYLSSPSASGPPQAASRLSSTQQTARLPCPTWGRNQRTGSVIVQQTPCCSGESAVRSRLPYKPRRCRCPAAPGVVRRRRPCSPPRELGADVVIKFEKTYFQMEAGFEIAEHAAHELRLGSLETDLSSIVQERTSRPVAGSFLNSRNANGLCLRLVFNSIGNRHASSGLIGMSGREEEDEGAGAGGTATEGGIKRVSRPSVKAREGKKVPDTSQQRSKKYRTNKLAAQVAQREDDLCHPARGGVTSPQQVTAGVSPTAGTSTACPGLSPAPSLKQPARRPRRQTWCCWSVGTRCRVRSTSHLSTKIGMGGMHAS